jgi:hypothetical protein
MNLPAAGKFGLLLVAWLALALPSANTHTVSAKPAPSQIVFWAWDEPEDMRALAGEHSGVAYLAATIKLDGAIHVSPRLQPLSVAPSTPLVAVVRIETRSGFRDTPQVRDGVSAAILDAANRPAIHAVQVDFDAVRSEREFYTAVLRQIRAKLPRTTTLSITALLSWCAHDDWIHALPVDEAVPMYFRLGTEAHNILNGDSAYAIREPLCAASAGIATDEPSHNIPLAGKGVYIFNPRPWTAHQLQLLSRSERP